MKERILIVDDDFLLVELLKSRFTNQGFEVMTAKDEKGFWTQAFQVKPDIILLDVHLNDFSGLAIYERMLEFGFDSKIPVIFMTDFVNHEHYEGAFRKGNYAFIPKPFQFSDLDREIEHFIYQNYVMEAII